MKKNIPVLLTLLFGLNCLVAQSDDQIILGTKHTIYSDTLAEERAYWVSLPESYEVGSTSYPVLIVLDGRAHFRAVSGMVNYMSAGYNGNRRIPEMIVVAIQNVDRSRDYTPDKIVTRRPNNFGGGDQFLSFLETELIPKLDQDYRTIPYRILFGHSLGGLLATHAYMKEKTLFNSFIAVDPSFGSWDAATMDKKLDAVTDQPFERFLYLATANWGKRNFKNRNRHVRLYEAMNSKCIGEFPAKMEYFENENHGSVPTIAFHNGISAIFQGYGISYRDIRDKEHLVQHFESISKRLFWDFSPPEALVNRLGYSLLRGDKAKALAFFILNTENYPNSYNAFDSLGEVYEALEDKTKAIFNYEKSLALNPENENAKARLAVLKN